MIDARLFVLVNNSLLLAFGLIFFGLQRTILQIGLSLFAACFSELVLSFHKLRANKFRGLLDRLISSSVAGVSVVVLLKSDTLWFYPFLSFLGIASKYFLRMTNGSHIFNPTNFAVVAGIALLPDFLQVQPDAFSSSYWLMAMIVTFGVLATFYGAVWRCTLAYFLTIICIGLPIGSLALHIKPLWILFPEINTSTLIFAFLMMTDPKTAPIKHLNQFLFGICVAMIHLFMRWRQIPFSPFIALFVVTAIKSALVEWLPAKKQPF